MAGKQVKATILPTAATNDANVNNGAKEETKKRQRINNGLLLVPTLLYRHTFYKYTWEPIQKIRQTKETDKTLVSIVNFVEDKYAELQSVQVAVSTY
jgi:dipeptidase